MSGHDPKLTPPPDLAWLIDELQPRYNHTRADGAGDPCDLCSLHRTTITQIQRLQRMIADERQTFATRVQAVQLQNEALSKQLEALLAERSERRSDVDHATIKALERRVEVLETRAGQQWLGLDGEVRAQRLIHDAAWRSSVERFEKIERTLSTLAASILYQP